MFLSLVEDIAPRKAAIILDEVQEIEEWQRLVRSFLDRGRTVCITGSNASLLGRELGSKLTGRQLTFEVFPSSYAEYLTYRRLKAGVASFTGFLDDGLPCISARTRSENPPGVAARHRAARRGRERCVGVRFRHGFRGIQVCAELTPFNRDRELQGVVRAAALPARKRRPLILTLDLRDRVTVANLVVEVLPAWEWMSRLSTSLARQTDSGGSRASSRSQSR